MRRGQLRLSDSLTVGLHPDLLLHQLQDCRWQRRGSSSARTAPGDQAGKAIVSLPMRRLLWRRSRKTTPAWGTGWLGARGLTYLILLEVSASFFHLATAVLQRASPLWPSFRPGMGWVGRTSGKKGGKIPGCGNTAAWPLEGRGGFHWRMKQLFKVQGDR